MKVRTSYCKFFHYNFKLQRLTEEPYIPSGVTSVTSGPKRRFELVLEVQRCTRARSECLPEGPKIVVTPVPVVNIENIGLGLLQLSDRNARKLALYRIDT